MRSCSVQWRKGVSLSYRDCSIHRERANMHFQGIACSRSFYVVLTSAVGHKLECLIGHITICFKYHENLINTLCSKVMAVFYFARALSKCILWSLCVKWPLWLGLEYLLFIGGRSNSKLIKWPSSGRRERERGNSLWNTINYSNNCCQV